MFVRVINYILKGFQRKKSPTVGAERGEAGICFEQEQLWP